MASAGFSAPTRLRGVVDDVAWGMILAEVTETVPDLWWPTSTRTYAMMRRDPQIQAILAAHTLPIRRATWTVNPTGCDPQVAQRVADDLGLPVAGQDTPGAARVRGVSWPDHLRMALQSLTYGHAAFELQAEIRDGQARLVGMYERLQGTIETIHVDRQARLLGISQDARADWNPPQIAADRLVFYSHEREGAAWQGTSLIRACYAAWLVKREMIRVHATSNRRFGAGVPVVRALPGTPVTPAQEAAAQRMASAIRVGEQGGASLPPGFVLDLVGLTGSQPDTLAFMKWLDQQMSGSVLARWMDLGDTSNGSRALGEQFVDTFMLSLQAIADEHADTITRHAAARIVGWNEGDAEPVPAVQVADVGASHEVTAEALNLLLNSGALSVDPGLEAHVRRQFKLPERRDMPQPAPSVRGGSLTAANPHRGAAPTTPAPQPAPGDDLATAAIAAATSRSWGTLKATETKQVSAKGRQTGDYSPPILTQPKNGSEPTSTGVAEPGEDPAKKQVQATQMELPITATGNDASRIAADLASAIAGFVKSWPALAGPLVNGLASDVATAVGGGVGGLTSLAAGAGAVAAVGAALGKAMRGLAKRSAQRAADEVTELGVPASAGSPDGDAVQGQADVTAHLVGQMLANSATRTALLQAGRDADDVAAAVKADLKDITDLKSGGYILQNLESALAAAQAAGRMATFAEVEDDIQLMAMEENDGPSRCQPCEDANGRVYSSFAKAAAAYPAGRNRSCTGRDRCHGHLRPVRRA